MQTVRDAEKRLHLPLERERTARMDGPSNTKIDYLKATHVALAMNETFGPLGWDVLLDDLKIVREYRCNRAGVEEEGGSMWNVISYAKVTVVTWTRDDSGEIKKTTRSDVASGTPYGDRAVTYLAAYDGSIKAAVSNAVKRACRFFGPQTGLLLALTSADERESLQALIDADAHAKEMEDAAPAECTAEPVVEPVAEPVVEEVAATESVAETAEAPVPTESAVDAPVEVAAEPVAPAEDAPAEPVTEAPEPETVLEGVKYDFNADPVCHCGLGESQHSAGTEHSFVDANEPGPVEVPAEPSEATTEVAQEDAPVEMAAESTPESATVEEEAPTSEELVHSAEALPPSTVVPPLVLLQLDGAEVAVKSVCALAEPTDAIDPADCAAIQAGLIGAFGEAATAALWRFVGADLAGTPLLVSRDQVLVLAQAIEEASAQEGGLDAFFKGLLDQEQIAADSAVADAASLLAQEAAANGSTDHGGQVEEAWGEWMAKLRLDPNNKQIIDELMTKGEEERVSQHVSAGLHGIAMHRLRSRNIPPANAMKMWKDVGVTFGKGVPTIKQAREFTALIPAD